MAVFNAVAADLGAPPMTGKADTVSLLTQGLWAHLPWLNVLWGLALLVALAKMVRGRWSLALRWADLGLYLCAILVMGRMLAGDPLVGLAPAGSTAPGGSLVPQMELMIRVALAGTALALAAGATQRFVSLLQMTRLGGWDVLRVGRFVGGMALGAALTVPLALLLRSPAYVGAGFPLGLVLGATLDQRTAGIAA
jgi:hypothetical protein